jgi:hypothetical protein|tara:strand:+ start:2103 stop:2504 length:402 start_codon:yes stop_codon:yes gene_type:complete
MTVDEFILDLNALGEELSDPQNILTEIGTGITVEMKRLAPVDTGALRNSIGYQINGNQITFDMLYYGMFQNYGVSGTEDSTGLPVPFGVLPPRVGNTYSFTKRRFGLRNQTFFNYDQIIDTIALGLGEQITDF